MTPEPGRLSPGRAPQPAGWDVGRPAPRGWPRGQIGCLYLNDSWQSYFSRDLDTHCPIF